MTDPKGRKDHLLFPDEEEDGEELYDSHAIYSVHEYGLDLGDGPEIYLTGNSNFIIGAGYEEGQSAQEPGVEYTMANRLIANLRIAAQAWPEERLLIHLKSCGGSWQEGMAIYDAIQFYPQPVSILNYTHARSMTSLIFCAARRPGDLRVMMPHSTFMWHTGTFGGEFTGTQARTELREWERSMDQMLDIYVETLMLGGSMSECEPEFIREWLKSEMKQHEEVYRDAGESVELGFADEIFDGDWARLKEFETE